MSIATSATSGSAGRVLAAGSLTYVTHGSLTDDVVERFEREPDSVALALWSAEDGEWRDMSVREFHAAITDIAKGFLAAGVQPGDRVVLRSRTRHEWTLVDYAIW